MASNNKATREKSMRGAPDAQDMPHPLLDLSEPAVNELIRSAKKRGYITLDQINSMLLSKATHSEQIEDIRSMFGKMGVHLVEKEAG